jgi:hypothetical protein
MRDIRYLLDENVDPRLRSGILGRDSSLTVWTIGDPGAPDRTTLDPAILCWCEDNSFILVTNNRRSMPRHLQEHLAAGRHVPGIFLLGPNMGFGDAIDELLLIWEASDAAEYRDTIIYLPLS